MPSDDHDKLVKLGARWLKRNGFPVVATELKCTGSREQPDVIGFRSSCSAVIEVKVSRSDFLADSKKPERTDGGLGIYRFYLCPEGLIVPADLPERWGLLEASGRQVNAVVAPHGNYWPGLEAPAEFAGSWAKFQHTPDSKAERSALFSIARRLS
tara:strand:+ start:13411 stop:13875 length:465 start_codon:yes stop_codon:yes gene_type:complete